MRSLFRLLLTSLRLLLPALLLLSAAPHLRAYYALNNEQPYAQNRVGNFLPPSEDSPLEFCAQLPPTQQENLSCYDEFASGNIVWTKFDPEGLEEFAADVMAHVNGVAPLLSLSPANTTGRMAALNFVGEEAQANHNKGFFMNVAHQWHDTAAKLGVVGWDPANVGTPGLGGAPLSKPGMPESWVRGNGLQKLATQLEPQYYDTGCANIKVKTALEIAGADHTRSAALVAEALTTYGGTAFVTSRLVENAQKDLNPFISAKTTQEQAQILTDYLRQGSQRFWESNGNVRNMTSEQVEQWRKNPDKFVMPDGSKPKPLAPNKEIDKDHMRQVEATEKKTQKEDDKKQWN